jgi:hydrogenase maturation protease
LFWCFDLVWKIFVKVLIAGVGHPNLKDLSFGQVLLAHLKTQDWLEEVDLENLSFGAIAVLQWFQDFPGRYQRVLFISAAERNREPGTLETYSWDFAPLDDLKVQECVAESVTGIISLDNLLVILQHFNVLPREVVVIEIEPVDSTIGFECSPAVTARFAEFSEIVRQKAMAPIVRDQAI